MLGGVSQMDTFDPKPALEKFDDTLMDWSKEKTTDQPNLFAKPRLIVGSPFQFKKYGAMRHGCFGAVATYRDVRG